MGATNRGWISTATRFQAILRGVVDGFVPRQDGETPIFQHQPLNAIPRRGVRASSRAPHKASTLPMP